jgi:hypothetical protein
MNRPTFAAYCAIANLHVALEERHFATAYL